jgi:hypothetical protein
MQQKKSNRERLFFEKNFSKFFSKNNLSLKAFFADEFVLFNKSPNRFIAIVY